MEVFILFENNHSISATDSCPDRGKSGIWIAPKKGSIDSSLAIILKIVNLVIMDVIYMEVAYGQSETIMNVLLNFVDCKFENNYVA